MRWAIRRRQRSRGNFFLGLAPRFALRQTQDPSHRLPMSYGPTCGSGGQVSGGTPTDREKHFTFQPQRFPPMEGLGQSYWDRQFA